MRTLVVGDVHGCARELSSLVDRAHAHRIVLVGDLFTKGPDPEGVWELIRLHHMESVRGNHELRLSRALKHKNDEGKRCKPSPQIARLVDRLDRADGSWRQWVKDLPLFLRAGPWTVVHAGLHPSGKLKRTTEVTATTVRRWPPGSDSGPWWDEVYQGKRRVIFGHDARRGLVDLRPSLLGLDTGCVYGGELTAYLVETDELMRVQAAQVYQPI